MAPVLAVAGRDLSSGDWQVSSDELTASWLLMPQLDEAIVVCAGAVPDGPECGPQRDVLADVLAALVAVTIGREGRLVSLLAYCSAALAPTFARLDACEDGKQAEVAEDVRQVLVGLRVIAESVRGPLEQA
ncbi:hypothetical protein [Streptomyces mirabilis]|uniref:hypothetical protein n=1 Tax=Streptomyces mirabilis TaxID=68239 RepID=UPI0036CC134D